MHRGGTFRALQSSISPHRAPPPAVRLTAAVGAKAVGRGTLVARRRVTGVVRYSVERIGGVGPWASTSR